MLSAVIKQLCLYVWEKNDILSLDSGLQVSCQTSIRRAEGLPLISSQPFFSVGCPIQNASLLLTPVSDAVFYSPLCGSQYFLRGSFNNRLFLKL